MKRKILFVKNWTGGYPEDWTPIQFDGEKYWLGGTTICVFKTQKELRKAKYHIKKQLKRFNPIFYTDKVEDFDELLKRGKKRK